MQRKDCSGEQRGRAGVAVQADLPQPPDLALDLSSHPVGKMETSRLGSQQREKQTPCYICMTILLYFSEQTSVVYVPVCPVSPPLSQIPSIVI